MRKNPIIEIEIFDIEVIDFIGPFIFSNPCVYLGGCQLRLKMGRSGRHTYEYSIAFCALTKNIFTMFRTPRAIINDGVSHFCNMKFEAILKTYGVSHKISTPGHLQTCGQVELANLKIKGILEKVVSANKKDWSNRLDDAL